MRFAGVTPVDAGRGGHGVSEGTRVGASEGSTHLFVQLELGRSRFDVARASRLRRLRSEVIQSRRGRGRDFREVDQPREERSRERAVKLCPRFPGGHSRCCGEREFHRQFLDLGTLDLSRSTAADDQVPVQVTLVRYWNHLDHSGSDPLRFLRHFPLDPIEAISASYTQWCRRPSRRTRTSESHM